MFGAGWWFAERWRRFGVTCMFMGRQRRFGVACMRLGRQRRFGIACMIAAASAAVKGAVSILRRLHDCGTISGGRAVP